MVDLNKDKLNMGGWRNLPFSEAVLINPTVRLERGIVYPFIDMAAVHAGSRWVYANKQRKYAGGGSRFQGGDTLMARITPCLENGKIARYRSTDTITTAYGSTEFIVIRGRPNVTDTGFAYYLTRWSEVRTYAISQMTGTSGRQRVPTSALDHIYVPIPPLPEQRVIAHILGTLDDKIELNRRMNETLEEMARAIFKSWFVDFDPVRAKMDGRWRRGESLPGMPAEMYDLFPSRLVDSELGEIPEGWRVGTLGTVLQQRIERCRPSLEIEAIPYVPIDCISSKSLFLTTNKSGKEARSSLTRFYQGDLLFGAMRPYYHKVCIAPFNGTTRTTAFVLFPKEPYDFGFSTMLLHAPDTIAYATRHSIGSTIPYAVWTSSLEEMQVILPPERIRKEFNRVVYPLLTKIPSVYFENRTLADLRDTLLPKLISGELRVGDAEKFMESVV